jgi:type IV secretion system protein VirB11
MNIPLSPARLLAHDECDTKWAKLSPYMRQVCAPIRPWLEDPTVIEIMVNRPGEVWIDAVGRPGMERFEVTELTHEAIVRLAERIAAETGQSVNEETPLLSAAMPHGERFQGVLAPASPDGGAFSIRKQVISNMRLEDYRSRGAFDNVSMPGDDELSELDRQLIALLKDRSPAGIVSTLQFAVKNSITMCISGGTASGKTTFLNALLAEVPFDERVLSIEDTRELKPPQPNYLALVASKGDQGKARVSVQSLLEAALRLRPDRLFLGEIRGAEAYTFLQAVNTGHPGSLTTLHANSPREAYERLALATMQAGLGLTKAEIVDYVRSVVPLVVQLKDKRQGRGLAEIYFSKWQAERSPRNEGVVDRSHNHE